MRTLCSPSNFHLLWLIVSRGEEEEVLAEELDTTMSVAIPNAHNKSTEKSGD